MASKEVKAVLKNARDAIRNKDYKEVLKQCKAVLKLEKHNYNAWVFIGLAASELEQPDQAQAAYRKAAELEPDQLLAWQGLGNLYEKVNQKGFKEDLPNVYQRLLELYKSSDKEKWCEVCNKLVDLYQQEKKHLQAAQTWHQLIKIKEDEGVKKTELYQLWEKMTLLLAEDVENQDNETQQLLLTTFENAVSCVEQVPGEEHQKLFKKFILCVSKLPHEDAKLKELCENMIEVYPTLCYPLEVLGLHYIKSGCTSEEAFHCYSRLSKLDPLNGTGLIGMGIKALHNRQYEVASKNLSQGLQQVSSCSSAWCYLAQVQLKLHKHTEAVLSCDQAIKDVTKDNLQPGACVQLDAALQVKAEALLEDTGLDSANVAIKIIEQISNDKNNPSLCVLRGQAYLKMGSLESASKILEELRKTHPQMADTHFLEGLLHFNGKKYPEAEKSFQSAVEHNPDTAQYYYYLGLTYWFMSEETRRDKAKAITQFLKAAKLDPYLSVAFCYLGHYYRDVAGDKSRARGCYKKAFELDGSDGEAGAAAVDLSMEIGDMVYESYLSLCINPLEK